jgi:hypothetical protein
MPLPPPVAREPIHNRTITCQGYRRADGLWDIEGRLVDTKSYAFANTWRSEVLPGEPIHEMLVRLTVDNDFVVVAVETASDNTPHQACGDILPNFQRLVGLRIGPGWSRRIKELTGGVQGCAHHVELIGVLATVAFQTIGPLLARERKESGQDEKVAAAPFLLNSCHIWREGGEWAKAFVNDPNGTLGDRQGRVTE